jgi:geranylgeranyl diphosphate synthase, type II
MRYAPAATPTLHLEGLRQRVEDGLRGLEVPPEPAALYDPVRYALAGEGKRLRPALVLLAAEACGGDPEDALPAALSTEVFHTFTLVHDDIMDAASERRGRPAVHVAYGDATAILAGDYLMGLAYDLLARTPTDDLAGLVRTFHVMVARVCEGQALDGAFEARDAVSVEEYLDMIGRKTGALLVCALELGGRAVGADDEALETLCEGGHALGRAFQIQDDLLDLTADDAGWGKAVGGDLVQGKKTLLLLRALERAEGEEHAWFQRITTGGGLPPAEVPEARARMERLGVLAEAAEAVRRHSEAAAHAFERLPDTEARDTLAWLARQLAARVR